MSDYTDKASKPEYWADHAASILRRLDRLDVKHPTNKPTSTHAYPLKWDLSGELQYEAFFLESVLTALTTSEHKVALRATFQAYSYIKQYKPDSYAHDWLLCARNRCEAFLGD